MHTNVTSDQQRQEANSVAPQAVRRLLYTLRRAVDAHLDNAVVADASNGAVLGFARLVGVLDSFIDAEAEVPAAQLVSSISSALEYHLSEVCQGEELGWSLAPSSALQPEGENPDARAIGREHHCGYVRPDIAVFSVEGARLQVGPSFGLDRGLER